MTQYCTHLGDRDRLKKERMFTEYKKAGNNFFFFFILPEIQRIYFINFLKNNNKYFCFISLHLFIYLCFSSTTGKHDGLNDCRKEAEENDDGVPPTFTAAVQKSGVRRSLSLFRVRCQTFTVQSPVSDVHCSGVWCQTFTVQSPVSDVHCSGVLCQTFTVQSPVSDVHCSESSVRRSLFRSPVSGIHRSRVRCQTRRCQNRQESYEYVQKNPMKYDTESSPPPHPNTPYHHYYHLHHCHHYHHHTTPTSLPPPPLSSLPPPPLPPHHHHHHHHCQRFIGPYQDTKTVFSAAWYAAFQTNRSVKNKKFTPTKLGQAN